MEFTNLEQPGRTHDIKLIEVEREYGRRYEIRVLDKAGEARAVYPYGDDYSKALEQYDIFVKAMMTKDQILNKADEHNALFAQHLADARSAGELDEPEGETHGNLHLRPRHGEAAAEEDAAGHADGRGRPDAH